MGGKSGSAVDRRVVSAAVLFSVEVNNLSTVGDQVVDGVESIALDNGGERDHLALSTRMPDDTLNETLAASDREEVNLSGGVGETHEVSCVDELSIGWIGAVWRVSVPV